MFAFFMFERTKPYAPIFLNYLVSNSVCFFFFFFDFVADKIHCKMGEGMFVLLTSHCPIVPLKMKLYSCKSPLFRHLWSSFRMLG